MSKALVIGNGESRRQTNFDSYLSHTIIGCNAIHRDLQVHHLICCDRRMAEEATNNPKINETKIYVRDHWYQYFRKIKKNKNVNLLPEVPTKGGLRKDEAEHWGSGPYAVLLAAVLDHEQIDLFGFDLYPIDRAVNNIYKGTVNYAREGSQAVDPSYWIYQIGSIFTYYPNIKFVIRNRQGWIMPEEWQKNNVEFIAL